MEYQPADKPAVIVLNHPATRSAPPGLARLPCDSCQVKFAAQLSTALTVQQLGDNRPPITCYDCYQLLCGDRDHSQDEIIGNKQARKRFGLDN